MKVLEQELASSVTTVETMKTNESHLEENCAALTTQLHNSATASTQLQSELDVLKTDLARSNAKADALQTDFDKTTSRLDQKQLEFAELQVAHREELVKLQAELNAQIDEYKNTLVDASVELKGLKEEKVELFEKLHRYEVEMATLKGDSLRMKEMGERAQVERERIQGEMTSLEGRLQAKNDEVMSTVANFSRTQVQEAITFLIRLCLSLFFLFFHRLFLSRK